MLELSPVSWVSGFPFGVYFPKFPDQRRKSLVYKASYRKGLRLSCWLPVLCCALLGESSLGWAGHGWPAWLCPHKPYLHKEASGQTWQFSPDSDEGVQTEPWHQVISDLVEPATWRPSARCKHVFGDVMTDLAVPSAACIAGSLNWGSVEASGAHW